MTKKLRPRNLTASGEYSCQLKGQLDKATEKIKRLKQEAISHQKQAETVEKKAEQDVAVMSEKLAWVQEMINKAETCTITLVEQGRKDATSKTRSSFLYTLWKRHLGIDFSFFRPHMVKEVQMYAAFAAKAAQAIKVAQ